MPEKLFISHASEDAAVADRIVAFLEARGVVCWIASRDIPPRSIYADAIVEGMQSCDACAVLVSAASNGSKAVKREVELASHEDKPFIPIRIDGSDPTSGLAYYLRNSQWIEYKRSGDSALERIAVQNRAEPPVPLSGPTPASIARSTLRTPVTMVLALLLVVAIGWGTWSMLGAPDRPSPDAEAIPAQTGLASGDPAGLSASQYIDRHVAAERSAFDGGPVEVAGHWHERSGESWLGGITFFDDGVFVNELGATGRWSRVGDLVEFGFGGQGARYVGAVDGLTMRGSILQENMPDRSFELSRHMMGPGSVSPFVGTWVSGETNADRRTTAFHANGYFTRTLDRADLPLDPHAADGWWAPTREGIVWMTNTGGLWIGRIESDRISARQFNSDGEVRGSEVLVRGPR